MYNNEIKKEKREMDTWIDKFMVIRTSFMQYIENDHKCYSFTNIL